ncbi:hypothetical protein L6452_03688 [Arctium lappa]|uniref:Uncharacterized protein n=1 Tax=Arctium lappa TaxID=4217 RepID=A0ACB9FMU9_ARCLA|nr:hypothetical protein L6452_03688 [Arctium lappa]
MLTRYLSNPVTLKLYHGGFFTKSPGREYIQGKMHYVDLVDTNEFSVLELESMVETLGYPTSIPTFYHFNVLGLSLDYGLKALGGIDAVDQDKGTKGVDQNKGKGNDQMNFFDGFDPFDGCFHEPILEEDHAQEIGSKVQGGAEDKNGEGVETSDEDGDDTIVDEGNIHLEFEVDGENLCGNS